MVWEDTPKAPYVQVLSDISTSLRSRGSSGLYEAAEMLLELLVHRAGEAVPGILSDSCDGMCVVILVCITRYGRSSVEQ